MEKISWTDHARNEDVLLRVKEQRNILHTEKKCRLTGLISSCEGTAFENTLLKEGWKERHKEREDKEKDVSSCRITFTK